MPELIKPNGAGETRPVLPKEIAVTESKKKLTAEQELRAENFKLKVRVAQLQAQLNDMNVRLINAQLNQEKIQLDNELGKDWMK